jgi:hypothetical protein
MAPRNLLHESRDAAAIMRHEAGKAYSEAQAQQYRCELIRTRHEQLRARLRDRYPNRFASTSQDSG